MGIIKLKEKILTPISMKKYPAKSKRDGPGHQPRFQDKKPLFIAILNGSFMFASDLFKHLQLKPRSVLSNLHLTGACVPAAMLLQPLAWTRT